MIRGVPYAETQDGHHFNPLTASIVVEAFEQLLNTDNQVTICSWVNVRADALARRLRPEDAE